MGISGRLVNNINELIEEGKRFRQKEKEQELIREYEKWTLNCIELLREIFGDKSEHLNDFINDKIKGEELLQNLLRKKLVFLRKYDEFNTIVEHQIGILESAKECIEKGISDLRTTISLEFYREILKIAESLNEKNLKDPAAILGFSILKSMLKREDSLWSKDEDKIRYFLELGESAVEGRFYLYNRDKVKEMLKWISKAIESRSDKNALFHY